jgi:hypothetical protein
VKARVAGWAGSVDSLDLGEFFARAGRRANRDVSREFSIDVMRTVVSEDSCLPTKSKHEVSTSSRKHR